MTEENYPDLAFASEKLASTENLSEHNKKVLDDFFDKWRYRVAETSCKDYANKWLNFAAEIDFKIDRAEREQVEELYKKLERGEICKENGREYSAQTKEKFHKALSTFYNNFIDYPGRGYNKETHGPGIVDGQKRLLSLEKFDGVETERIPSPNQVRDIALELDSFRDRCILVFCWSTGARSGEIFPTSSKPSYLQWKDIELHDDSSMSVRLGINKKKSNGGNRRTVQIITGKAMIKELYRRQKPKPEDPVFVKKNPTLLCPKCSTKVERVEGEKSKPSYERNYRCLKCETVFKRSSLQTEKEPLKRKRVNDIIGKAVSKSDYNNLKKTSHPFFRKARALQKVATNSDSINGFFGWEVGSSEAKKRYIDALQVSQRKDLKEQHPELDVDVNGRFHDDSLKPSKCSHCGRLNSRLWDFCRNCDQELTYQGLAMKGASSEKSTKEKIRNETKDEMIEFLKEKADISDSEFKEALVERVDERVEDEVAEA